jgi:hypothetical protein
LKPALTRRASSFLDPSKESDVNADDFLAQARATIASRKSDRDRANERSMPRIVAAFNALTGNALSERDGWIFMVVLKLARAEVGSGNPDHYVDGAAYFALAGESACGGGGPTRPDQPILLGDD